MHDSRIIVALDYASADDALVFVKKVKPEQCKLKVGKELFTTAGPDLVRKLVDMGFDVFLDLKFHDIPNTVAAACSAAARLGVWMVNVHALGGPAMLQAAQAAIAQSTHRPKLIAVTVLTSMDAHELSAVGIVQSPEFEVSRLAALAEDAGLDGVVCSAMEAKSLRAQRRNDFLLVTPGIRPRNSDVADQKRIVTPADAIQSGVNYLVIGRPITQSPEPMLALQQIQDEIANV